MSTLMDSAPPARTRTHTHLAITAMLCGAGTAVGVPWAVFRYGPEVDIGPIMAWLLALAGIVGGVLVLLRATASMSRGAP